MDKPREGWEKKERKQTTQRDGSRRPRRQSSRLRRLSCRHRRRRRRRRTRRREARAREAGCAASCPRPARVNSLLAAASRGLRGLASFSPRPVCSSRDSRRGWPAPARAGAPEPGECAWSNPIRPRNEAARGTSSPSPGRQSGKTAPPIDPGLPDFFFCKEWCSRHSCSIAP